MKRCVVIGSGLAGLTSAVILAKNGYQVTVLEQAAQMGGCLQCFARGDALFDTGMHYVGSADPGQTMHTMFRYLELENRIPLSRLDPSGYDIIALNGERWPTANKRLSRLWQSIFPTAASSCTNIISWLIAWLHRR